MATYLAEAHGLALVRAKEIQIQLVNAICRAPLQLGSVSAITNYMSRNPRLGLACHQVKEELTNTISQSISSLWNLRQGFQIKYTNLKEKVIFISTR